MGNIVSYIQSNQHTFAESPFNSVDSLVFSTLAYFNFETANIVDASSSRRVLIHDVVALSNWQALINANWLQDAKDTQPFLHALMASRRYRDVRFAFYVNECSDTVEKQFSAVTFFFNEMEDTGEDHVYLAFRGTDGSFAGWKEDFNLCFKNVIPSQCTAAAYVSGVASAVSGPLILGGHSKGGNLAEYAALSVEEGTYKRIKAVFNHDGPSFLDDPSPRIHDTRFDGLLHKTVPESSAFGMILERRPGYRVVQSSALFVFQHEPFSWQVEGCDFLYQDKLNPSARFFDDALDTWLRNKTTADRERFIDTIYDLFVSTEARTWGEYRDKLLSNTRQLISTSTKLDSETKRFIMQTLGSLGAILREETVRKFRPSPPEWIPHRKERYNGDAASSPNHTPSAKSKRSILPRKKRSPLPLETEVCEHTDKGSDDQRKGTLRA